MQIKDIQQKGDDLSDCAKQGYAGKLVNSDLVIWKIIGIYILAGEYNRATWYEKLNIKLYFFFFIRTSPVIEFFLLYLHSNVKRRRSVDRLTG